MSGGPSRLNDIVGNDGIVLFAKDPAIRATGHKRIKSLKVQEPFFLEKTDKDSRAATIIQYAL